MTQVPNFPVDPAAFAADPYPTLAQMQAAAPVVRVPQLGALLMTRRDDIFTQEKNIATFSSLQPDGLMTRLMGENMMRKDGAAHMAERKATFPAFSPRTVRDRWLARFRAATAAVLEELQPRGACDLVRDFAMPVSGHALRAITGLEEMRADEMDHVSQGMIDGIANYTGDPEVEARCHAATRLIDTHIDRMRDRAPDGSLLAVQQAAGLPDPSIRANIKLAISGGQNEPRDAIAGAAWALLTHPDQLERVRAEGAWQAAFAEYARWISPIGMSPRQIATPATLLGHAFQTGERVFLMFGAGNRDPRAFEAPDIFDTTRDTSKSLAFGAGPHFCAGAAASRALVADVALPMLFDRLPRLRLTGPVRFHGWAFRGPVTVPVAW
ncbi:MAG: cytochrome P450 [Pseudomonadota bacterium]